MGYSSFLQRLQQEMGADNFLSQADEISLKLNREYHRRDVLLPRNTEQLVTMVRLANQYHVPLYPIGNGSRFSQGIGPFEEGVLVSLRQMEGVVENRPDNMSIEVEAGITVSKVQEVLKADNIYFPIDANDRSTVGGLIAANGYGRKKYRYKTTRFYVLGMEFVSPQGELIQVGGRTIKNVSSYDLHQLLTGSWGVFGIITKAILKVAPIPEKILVMARLVKGAEGLVETIAKVLFQEQFNVAAVTFSQAASGFLVQAELEGFAKTLKLQQEVLQSQYGFEETFHVSDAGHEANVKISLPLKNYLPGLNQVLGIQQSYPHITIGGNAGSGLIYLKIDDDRVIDELKDIVIPLEGELVWKNLNLTQKECRSGLKNLLWDIKKAIDPNHILVPSTRVLKG